MPEENIDQISDAEIFESATSPEPVAEAPKEGEAEAAREERARDEKGRFAAKETATEEVAPVVEAPKAEERPDHIPSWRLREEAEARRDAERRAQQMESMLAQYEARLRQMQPEPELPDFLEHPESIPEYLEHIMAQREQRWKAEFRQATANMSLERAHDRHGEFFMEAFNEITSRPLSDPVRQQVINSPDPGETLVKLYKDHKHLSAIGNEDLETYIQKRLDAALENPEYLAKAVERARGVASAQPTQQIRTPPSLNKASGARMPQDDTDVSDEALYRYATGR